MCVPCMHFYLLDKNVRRYFKNILNNFNSSITAPKQITVRFSLWSRLGLGLGFSNIMLKKSKAAVYLVLFIITKLDLLNWRSQLW